MAALTDILKPLDPAGSQPLYQQLQRAIREAIERRLLGPDDALPAGAPDRRRARRLAHHGAQGDRRPGGGRAARAPPGLGQLRRLAHREELLQAHLVLRGHACARPHAAQRMAEALAGHGDAGRSADAALEPRRARSIASTASASPTTRRWRSSTRRCSAACLPSLEAVRSLAVRSARARRQPPGARAAAPARGAAHRRAGEAAARARGRRGPARGARRDSCGTAARWNSPSRTSAATSTTSSRSSAPGSIERPATRRPRACSGRRRRRPSRGASAARANAATVARLARRLRDRAAPRGGHLRARQLRSRRDLRQVPDRDAHRRSSPRRPRPR